MPKYAPVMIFLIIGLFLAIGSAGAQQKSIVRTADPMVVPGTKLADLHGAPIHHIGLFAIVDSKLEPVPFQIDEHTSAGRFVLPEGPKANIDEDDNFDSSDELVFMVKDSGAKAGADDIPPEVKIAVELTLTDPKNGAKGWFYALVFDSEPPRSKVDYVRYDSSTNKIYASNYTMGFSGKAPIAIGHLSLTKAGGGDDVNYADRLKVRFKAKAMGGMVAIDKNEQGFESYVIAWKDGPVRVVRRTRNRQTLFWKIPTPSAYLENIYYYNIFEFPTLIDLPFDVDTFISNPKFRVSTDSLCGTKGRYFFNEKNPNPVTIDGVMSEAEKNLDKSPYAWMVVGMEPPSTGAWMNRLIYDKNATPAVPMLYYMDDKNIDDSPEEQKGQCGDVGYSLENLEKVEKGVLKLTSVMYNIPDFDKSKIRTYMDILDKPVLVTTRKIR